MRNVAYLISMPHGLDRWTFREVEALTRQGMQIALFPIRWHAGPYLPPPMWRCYRFRGWQVIAQQLIAMPRLQGAYFRLLWEALRTRTLIDFLLAVAFSQQMRRWNIDRIHCVFGDHKLFVGYYCQRLLHVPLSAAIYGYELKANPNWSMFRRALSVCDDVITNCEYNRQLIEERTGDRNDKVHVIRHYAEVTSARTVAPLNVLIVGGFSERKGHDVLFKAVYALGERGCDVEVWVVGYAGTVDVAALARDLGVADRVRVFGAVPDALVDFLFDQCDLFCLPSKTDQDGISEGLPVALIEAMAHGKPVISTHIAGIPELVETTLVPENDHAALAAALERYIGDPGLRAREGARNQDIVRAQYSPRNLEAMRQVFNGEAQP